MEKKGKVTGNRNPNADWKQDLDVKAILGKREISNHLTLISFTHDL